MRRLSLFAILCLVVPASQVRAQPTPAGPDLLTVVPKDFALCLSINDLKGHWNKFEQAGWVQALKKAPMGQAVLGSPEFADLAKFQNELKQHLQVDWPTLRDEIFGEHVVFAYRPPASTGGGEQGLLLVRARKPSELSGLIGRLNELQKNAGELKELEERQHQGVTYYRRVLDKNTHYYLLQGSLFALSSKEEALKSVIERRGETTSPVRDAIRRADAERAWAALWLNPRAFDTELQAKAENAQGPETAFLNQLTAHWKALDGVVIAFDLNDDVELRLTLLARAGEFPGVAKDWLGKAAQTSELWQRFPSNSILSVAGRTDFRAVADQLLEVAPPEFRKLIVDAAGKNIRAALSLDLFEDVLPNVGPDWGLCILPASAGKQFPQAVIALAVRSGKKDVAVDQSIYKALQFFTGLALFQHNVRSGSDPIEIKTLRQGDVEVKHLVQDRLFPAGFQPACALKDGYLLLATSPAAVSQFQRQSTSASTGDDVPLVRFAPTELGQLLRQHRERVVEQMTAKNQQSKAAANQDLDSLLTLLDLCRQVTLSQRTSAGRLQWSVRAQMTPGER